MRASGLQQVAVSNIFGQSSAPGAAVAASGLAVSSGAHRASITKDLASSGGGVGGTGMKMNAL